MFIELETIEKSNLLMKYLEKTNYRWASGHNPTDWWRQLSPMDKKQTIETAVLGLDVYGENRLFLYGKYEISHNARFAKEPRTTATEYLTAMKKNTFIIINKEV